MSAATSPAVHGGPQRPRYCSGPGGLGPWCGRLASHVARDDKGSAWFTCEQGHPGEHSRETIAEWWNKDQNEATAYAVVHAFGKLARRFGGSR